MLHCVLDFADHLLTLGRLGIADWLLGPLPETAADRALRKQGERLREAFSGAASTSSRPRTRWRYPDA
jgi:hypothetical protein